MSKQKNFATPALEELEARVVPTVVCDANPVYTAECDYLAGLISAAAITVTAQRSGNWSDPATWGGRVPGNGDNAWVPNGITVTVDRQEPGALRSILDNGTLQFATNVNTSLTVDTLVVGTDNNPSGLPQGTLTIGTAANPVQAGVKAVLTFADDAALGTAFPNDWQQMSRGLISMNTVSIYGAQVTPYVALAQNVAAGATALQLAQAPVGWSVGDTLLLPGTSAAKNQDEQIQIQTITGTQVTLARPLAYGHAAPAGQSVQVADEARTVVLQSQNAADSTRHGHVMFMHTDQETVAYADFLNLGRTDKSVPLNNAQLDANGNVVAGTGTNQVGRYALHFHRDYWPSLSGNDPPILVLGNYESGSPGWGYDNHSSNVDFEQNVAFNNFGAGFATEAGNEIGTFNANLAVRTIGVANGTSFTALDARHGLNDFGFNGAGYWMQSPGCTLTNNIALDSQVGFDYYNLSLTEKGLGQIQFWTANATDASAYYGSLVSTQAVQIPLFSGNVAAEATDAMQLFWHLPVTMPVPAGVHSVIDHFTAWDVSDGITSGIWAARITVQSSSLTANPAAPGYGIYMAGAGYGSQLTVSNTNVVGFGTGLTLPTRGPNQVTGGYWDNQTNFSIPPQASNLVSGRQIAFSGPITFGPHSQVNYQFTTDPEQVSDPNCYFVPQQVVLPDGRELYYANQAANYVPFPATNSLVPAAFVGLTNQQLWTRYALAMEGAVAPVDAAAYTMSNGIAGAAQNVPPYFRLWSSVSVTSGASYTLSYQVPSSAVITDPTAVTLQPGWNVITRIITGATHSWLVDYLAPAAVATLSISGLNYGQLAGTPVTIAVTALDASGNPVTGYTGTVTLRSSDARAVLPANYTFTASDQGTHSFSVTFNTTGTQSLTVMDVSNASVSGIQTGISVSQPAAGPVLLKDTFNDANGTPIQGHTMDVGPGWRILIGSWVIQNRQLNLTDNQAHQDAIVANAGRSDVAVSLNFTTARQSDTGVVGIVLRALDAQNYWLVYLHNNQLSLYKLQAGTWSLMAGPVTVPISSGTTYTLKAVASGSTITCFVNGVQWQQYAGATFLQGATQHGIYSYRDPAGSQPLVGINSFECDTN